MVGLFVLDKNIAQSSKTKTPKRRHIGESKPIFTVIRHGITSRVAEPELSTSPLPKPTTEQDPEPVQLIFFSHN